MDRNDTDRDYFLNLYRNIIKTDNGYCLQKVYKEDENGFVDDENSDDTSGLDVVSRDYLESAIKDYNAYFKTDYDTSADTAHMRIY